MANLTSEIYTLVVFTYATFAFTHYREDKQREALLSIEEGADRDWKDRFTRVRNHESSPSVNGETEHRHTHKAWETLKNTIEGNGCPAKINHGSMVTLLLSIVVLQVVNIASPLLDFVVGFMFTTDRPDFYVGILFNIALVGFYAWFGVLLWYSRKNLQSLEAFVEKVNKLENTWRHLAESNLSILNSLSPPSEKTIDS